MNKQGFTLVETLLYALLVGMIVSGLISFSLAMISIKAKSEIIAEINANINDLGDIISREVKTAQEIITPGPGQSSDSLVLIAPVNNTKTITVADGLVAITDATETLYLSSDEIAVSGLNFVNLGSLGQDSIRVVFTAQNQPAGSQEYKYLEQAQLAITRW